MTLIRFRETGKEIQRDVNPILGWLTCGGEMICYRRKTALLQDGFQRSTFKAGSEKQMQGFSKMFLGLFRRVTLGGHIQRGASGNVPLLLTSDADGKLKGHFHSVAGFHAQPLRAWLKEASGFKVFLAILLGAVNDNLKKHQPKE